MTRNLLSSTENKNTDNVWFALTMLYLIFEYSRPGDFIPILNLIRPAMIISFLLIASWFFGGNFNKCYCKQSTAIFLFIFYLALFIPFARNNGYALAIVRGFCLNLPFLISVIIYVNTFERLRKFISIYTILLIYLCIRIILHGGGAYVGSYFLRDENDYAMVLNTMFPFSVFLFLYNTKFKKKGFYAIGAVFAMISIVISLSRGGFIGLIFTGLVVWLFSPRKMVTVLLIGVLAVCFFCFTSEKYVNEILSISSSIDKENSTANIRLEAWKSGWAMFLEHPFGVGGGNFRVWFPYYQTDYFKYGMYGRLAHSIWIQLLTESGIIGVFIYLFLLFYNLKDIFWLKKFKDNKDKDISFAFYISLGLLCSIAGYLSAGTFISVLYFPQFFVLTAIVVVTRRLVEKKIQTEK